MTIHVATEKGNIKVTPDFRVSKTVQKKIEQTLRLLVEDVKPIEGLLAKIKRDDPVVGTPQGALIAYMTGQGFTQKRLAAKTGISQADISKMVNGKRTIGPITAKKFAKVFGVDHRRFL